MAAIDFPNDPNVNDEFTVGDQAWRWTGDFWRLVGTPGAAGPAGADGAPGIVWRGPWDSMGMTTYDVNDVVSFQGSTYINTGGAGGTPPNFGMGWALFAAAGQQGTDGAIGMNWTGAWDSEASYLVGDGVSFYGSSYIYKGINAGNSNPGATPSDWDVLASVGNPGQGFPQFGSTSVETFVTADIGTEKVVSFDTYGTQYAYTVGNHVRLGIFESPSVEVFAQITSIGGTVPGTVEFTLLIESVSGSTVFGTWLISLSGKNGAQGTPGLIFAGNWQTGLTYSEFSVVAHEGATWTTIPGSGTVPVDEVPGISLYWMLLAAKGDVGPAGIGYGFSQTTYPGSLPPANQMLSEGDLYVGYNYTLYGSVGAFNVGDYIKLSTADASTQLWGYLVAINDAGTSMENIVVTIQSWTSFNANSYYLWEVSLASPTDGYSGRRVVTSQGIVGYVNDDINLDTLYGGASLVYYGQVGAYKAGDRIQLANLNYPNLNVQGIVTSAGALGSSGEGMDIFVDKWSGTGWLTDYTISLCGPEGDGYGFEPVFLPGEPFGAAAYPVSDSTVTVGDWYAISGKIGAYKVGDYVRLTSPDAPTLYIEGVIISLDNPGTGPQGVTVEIRNWVLDSNFYQFPKMSLAGIPGPAGSDAVTPFHPFFTI